MGLSFVYHRNTTLGSQFTLTCGRGHLVAALMHDGHSEVDANKIVDRGQSQVKGGVTPAIRVPRVRSQVIESDRQVVAEFVTEHYFPQRTATTLFSSFYEGFVKWLEPSQRPNWSKKRVSQALPANYRSVPGNRNVRVIENLVKRPA